MSEDTALRHAKICFLWDESLLKQAAGVVYKDVLQGAPGVAILACLKPPSKTFPSHSAIKSETPVRRTSSGFSKSWLENYQNGKRCQLRLSTFQMKSVSAPITCRYTGPILPEHYYLKNPFFWHYQLKLANYTTTFCFESHLRLKLPIILKHIL